MGLICPRDAPPNLASKNHAPLPVTSKRLTAVAGVPNAARCDPLLVIWAMAPAAGVVPVLSDRAAEVESIDDVMILDDGGGALAQMKLPRPLGCSPVASSVLEGLNLWQRELARAPECGPLRCRARERTRSMHRGSQ